MRRLTRNHGCQCYQPRRGELRATRLRPTGWQRDQLPTTRSLLLAKIPTDRSQVEAETVGIRLAGGTHLFDDG